ncbi:MULTISPECIES: hypothetical protein [unclassified Nostoc]|uniref:hypothetical protein n=1 Tax=unclassified Nostoc TaxID=2593658 RepID=UPI002AD3AB97|nr:hypothetical protein [Nostoc sp. DedQUE03]MDZ7971762.1 hypothetical protein [Nostoc sp. DedQUE03]MDZ8049055.1 hypothetical protein [Nostoc sp. DedQUE02]
MNSQNTQQKKNSQSLNNSEFRGASQNDGVSVDNSQGFQSSVDVNKTELNDVTEEKEVQDFAEGILPSNKELKTCGWYNGDYVCTKP